MRKDIVYRMSKGIVYRMCKDIVYIFYIDKNSKGVKVHAFGDGRNGDVGSVCGNGDDRGGGRGGAMECGERVNAKIGTMMRFWRYIAVGLAGARKYLFQKQKIFSKTP